MRESCLLLDRRIFVVLIALALLSQFSSPSTEFAWANPEFSVSRTHTSLTPSSITCTTIRQSIILGEGIAVAGGITPAVSGASVTIEYRMGSTAISRVYGTGADGTYHDSYTPTVAGSWTVVASWAGNGQYAGASSPPLVITVSQPAAPTGIMKVTVLDKDGKPIVGAGVSSTSAPSGQSALSGVSGADGSVSFNNLAVGAYTIEARMSGYVTNSTLTQVTAGGSVAVPINLQTQTGVAQSQGIPGYRIEMIMAGTLLAMGLLLWIRGKH